MPEVPPLTRREFEHYCIGTKLTYEDYVKTHCQNCTKRLDCPHYDNFRRLPQYVGGLGLCSNLQ